MHLGEATMTSSVAPPRGVQHSRSEPVAPQPAASLRDTLVLLLAMGAIVVVGGLVTVLVLHPISARDVLEWVVSILTHV